MLKASILLLIKKLVHYVHKQLLENNYNSVLENNNDIKSNKKKYGNCKRDPLKWRDQEPEPQKSGGSATQRHLKVSKLPRFVLWPH